MKRALALLLLALIFAPTRSVRADQASEAQLQFELGSELYKQGRYVEAIDRFVAANRLAPNPNFVLNVAQTFVFLKRPVDAYNWYSSYLAFALTDDKRAQGSAAREALLPEVAVLDVASEPAGAELFVDRLELGSVGKSPRKIAVEAGSHRVVARLPGHHDSELVVAAERGRESPARLELSVIVGELSVVTEPAGAQIRLQPGAKELGKSPLLSTLPAGELRLTISAPGYVDQSRTVVVEPGKRTQFALKLVRAASAVSVLSVKGNVQGARVLLDGVELGAAPLSLPDITSGTRVLRLQAPGHEPWTGKVPLEPGSATRVDFKLLDPRTRPWKGWRYLGYGTGGAVLAASAITGLLALRAHSDFNKEPSAAGLSKLNTLNTGADVLALCGGVVTATTLIWDLLTVEKKSSATVSLQR